MNTLTLTNKKILYLHEINQVYLVVILKYENRIKDISFFFNSGYSLKF
jgi:hypothetical protein